MPAISSNDLARRPAVLNIGQLGQSRLGAVPRKSDVDGTVTLGSVLPSLPSSPIADYDPHRFAVADGDPISTVVDYESGYDLAASAPGEPTESIAFGYNSRDAMGFDGTDDVALRNMDAMILIPPTSFSFFVLHLDPAFPDDGSVQIPFCTYNATYTWTIEVSYDASIPATYLVAKLSGDYGSGMVSAPAEVVISAPLYGNSVSDVRDQPIILSLYTTPTDLYLDAYYLADGWWSTTPGVSISEAKGGADPATAVSDVTMGAATGALGASNYFLGKILRALFFGSLTPAEYAAVKEALRIIYTTSVPSTVIDYLYRWKDVGLNSASSSWSEVFK